MAEIIPFFEKTPATFRMIPVEGGRFDMGGESWHNDASLPIHQVELSNFWIGEFPVTQALWEYVLKTKPARFQGANRPIEQVSWNDIVKEFLPALNQQTEGQRPKGAFFRLPTEAEWEYAARGGKKRDKDGYLYAGGNKLEEVGWYNDNSNSETKPVGLKLPNELGLFDMSGNVLEWCHDLFDDKYYEKCNEKGVVKDTTGPDEEGTFRVLRGGSWLYDPQYCRTPYRASGSPADRYNHIGFRLVLSSLPV